MFRSVTLEVMMSAQQNVIRSNISDFFQLAHVSKKVVMIVFQIFFDPVTSKSIELFGVPSVICWTNLFFIYRKHCSLLRKLCKIT